MNRATYHPKDSITLHFSKGYTGSKIEEVPFPSIPQLPAGTLTTTTEDLSNFVGMLLNSGRFKDKQILSPSSIRRLETPETSLRSEAGIKFGYGKGIQGNFEKGYHFYGHSGRAGGFLSEFGYSRELDLGYVILINSVDGGKAIKAIKSVLLSSIDNRENEQLDQDPEVASAPLNDLTGGYQPITSVPQLGEIGYFVYRLIDMPIIEEENGQLYQSSMVGGQQALLHVQDLLFKNPGEPIATSAFVEVQDESWQWLTSDASYKQIPLWWAYTQFYVALICVLLIVTGFISFLFWIPVRIIRKRTENLQLQLAPFLAICFLLAMIASIVLFYDPEKMYSIGAILFLIFGWLFFICSFLALVKVINIFRKKEAVNGWIKYHALFITLACCISASYLFYWDIIGLMLWNY
jgi:hypothetical protein